MLICGDETEISGCLRLSRFEGLVSHEFVPQPLACVEVFFFFFFFLGGGGGYLGHKGDNTLKYMYVAHLYTSWPTPL